jgi:hypothetical protein
MHFLQEVSYLQITRNIPHGRMCGTGPTGSGRVAALACKSRILYALKVYGSTRLFGIKWLATTASFNRTQSFS